MDGYSPQQMQGPTFNLFKELENFAELDFPNKARKVHRVIDFNKFGNGSNKQWFVQHPDELAKFLAAVQNFNERNNATSSVTAIYDRNNDTMKITKTKTGR